LEGVDEDGEADEEDSQDGDPADSAAAAAVAIQESLFLEEDVELPDDFE
jgi:hypothetical protein